MGAATEIAWTDATFNPWWGCVRVSPGCVNCYAENFAKRTGNAVWGVQAPRRFFGEKHWNEPINWNKAAEIAGVRKRVFCASMADVFEDRDELDPWREKLWGLIERTPMLDWQLLTKRPENIAWRLPDRWSPLSGNRRVPRNLWLGTTAEDQEHYDRRWPMLADAARDFSVSTTFVSYEPALGPLTLLCHGCGHDVATHCAPDQGGCSGWFPSWVIAGGESGNGARDFDLQWALSLAKQCQRARVPYFFKQAGSKPIDSQGPFAKPSRQPTRLRLADRKGGDLSELPHALNVREFPGVHRV